MEEKINELYIRIEEYAEQKNLPYLLKALPFVREVMTKRAKTASAQARYLKEFIHCLEMCMMLIDLQPELGNEEEDAMLSAVILHIYPENISVDDLEEKLVAEWGFSREIYEIIDTITLEDDLTDEEQRFYYDCIQKNKLALLVALADRSNVVQQLHRLSTWNAHRYINETKACYFPMCIYGKEHYHELLAVISILLEKIRTLIEVAEVLLRRYESREAELIQDILAIREENATIRGIIEKFRSEMD